MIFENLATIIRASRKSQSELGDERGYRVNGGAVARPHIPSISYHDSSASIIATNIISRKERQRIQIKIRTYENQKASWHASQALMRE
jgi:hypothetical protein